MMKSLQLSLYVLLATGLCMPCAAAPVHTFFSIRSQSVRASRDLLGWQDYINCYKPDKDCYTAFAATVEYDQSIRARNLANYFFGCNRITFSGSQVADRGANDLLADVEYSENLHAHLIWPLAKAVAGCQITRKQYKKLKHNG